MGWERERWEREVGGGEEVVNEGLLSSHYPSLSRSPYITPSTPPLSLFLHAYLARGRRQQIQHHLLHLRQVPELAHGVQHVRVRHLVHIKGGTGHG